MKETLNYYRELLFSLEKEYNNLSPSDVRSHSHLPDKIEMVKQFIETLESFEIIFDSEIKELREENERLKNDNKDILDLGTHKEPTALANVVKELQQAQDRVKELEEELKDWEMNSEY